MQKSPPAPPTRRLNVRTAILLAVLVVLATVGVVSLHFRQASRLRDAALVAARGLADGGRVDQAVQNLNELLRTHPRDPEALEFRARLLAESARTLDQLLAAAAANDLYLRAYPEAPGAQEVRRRTAELYIRFGEVYRDSPYHRIAPENSVFNLRYAAAAALAQALIDRDDGDSDAHLLLARARDGLAWTGGPRMVDEAIPEYRRTLELDPGNLKAAERLASLLGERKRDPAGAVAVLDELMGHRPDSPELRMVRHRFFVGLGRDAEASAELDAAFRLAPDDPSACVEAADLALRRGRADEARRFVDRIPAGRRDGLRVRLILGLIELNEDHPGEAIEIWRKGLVSSQGSDAMLTWNLAFSLLQLGRLAEAGPLIAQYRRLIDDESAPMLNLLLAIEEQKDGRSLKAALRLEAIRSRIDARWRPMLEYTLGRCYAETGDYPRAVAAYRQMLLENPRAVAARVDLAEILENSRPREAVDVIEAGLRTHPDAPSLWVALASALVREQERLPADARSWAAFDRAMARAVGLAPGHPSLTLIRSRRESLDGRTDDATAMLEEAVRREPRKPKLWETYIETLLRAGRTDEALAVLERASDTGAIGDTVGIRLARFGVLQGLGRSREARARLARDAEKFVPDQQARIWRDLGRDLDARGDLAGAREVYRRWAERAPDDDRPRLALLEMAVYGGPADGRAAADALRGLGGPGGLAAGLARALELIRGAPEAPRAGTPGDARLLEAERALQAARERAPTAPAVDAIQGELSGRRGRVEDAARAYRQAWDRGAEGVLPRLVDLLARQNPDELERLCSLSDSPRLIQMAARACLGIGQPDRAARIVAEKAPESETPAMMAWRAELLQRLGPADPSNRSVDSETPEMLAWRVELLRRLGRADRSEELLRAHAKRHPDLAEPWLALLRFQAGQGRAGAVASTLEEARRAIKDPRTELVNARLCRAAGDRAGADRSFWACLEKHPDDVEALVAAADFDLETGRPAEAERRLGRALALKPGHRGASRRLAMSLTARPFDEAGWERAWAALGPESAGAEGPEDRMVRAVLLSRGPGPDHRRRATELLEELVADLSGQAGVSSTARGLLARIRLDAGIPDQAVRLLGPSVDRGEGDAPEIALYAEALLAAGRLEPAGEQLDRLATIAPGDDREARLRARLVAARARPGEAAGDLERAFLARGESSSAASFGREAFALIAAGSPPADDVAERLGLALASRDPGASWMAALIAGRHARASEALRLCKAAAEVASPADAREACRVAAGVALGDAGADRRGELEAVLEAASRRDPDGTEIPLQFAQLRHRQGRFEDAVRIYREIIGRRPDLRASIQNNIAWVLCEDLHRPEEAIKVADDLLRTQGRAAAVLDTRGVILTRLRRTEEAIRDLEESIRIGPAPAHLFHLARAYRDAGKTREFLRCRDLARRAGLTPEQVDPSERAELASIMKP